MSEQVRVLIADKMDPRAAAIFRQRGIEVDEKPGLTPDELSPYSVSWATRIASSSPLTRITGFTGPNDSSE